MDDLVSKLIKKEYDKIAKDEALVLGICGYDISEYIAYKRNEKEANKQTKKLSLKLNK